MSVIDDIRKRQIKHAIMFKSTGLPPFYIDIESLLKLLDEVAELPDKWFKEAQEPVSTDEGYCINGTYQFCATELKAILESTQEKEK